MSGGLKLLAAHQAGQLKFFGDHTALTERKAFATYLAPLRKIKWYVYTKPPFGGPKAVLAYLARYTHRVAISNRRLIALDSRGVTFKYKDYRADGRARYKVMKLATHEFIRRFLIHVLPDGFHRIRHYGLFASAARADNIARARQLLNAPRRGRCATLDGLCGAPGGGRRNWAGSTACSRGEMGYGHVCCPGLPRALSVFQTWHRKNIERVQ